MRSVNDSIRQLGPSWNGTHDFVCECVDPRCFQSLSASSVVYDDVRAEDRQFVVVPGHEHPESEILVTGAVGYLVVSRLKGLS